jgi:hypothetical protein
MVKFTIILRCLSVDCSAHDRNNWSVFVIFIVA